eukprot:jgi/Tetstr1/450351/TSEL_037387.t1
MDGYKVGSKDGFAGRLEVIEGRTGRRRWSEVEKARIASESFRPGARVAEVARRHGTTRWQIYDWRKRLTRGMLTAPADDSLAFASVVIAPESPRSSPVQKKDAAPTDVVEVLRVYVATRPVDFRKGMDGLALVVQEVLGLDPFSGAAFVFRSKRADRIKVLIWDRTGLVLVHKRLEGCKFVWPQVRNGVLTLSPSQFSALFEGIDWRMVRPEAERRPTVAG